MPIVDPAERQEKASARRRARWERRARLRGIYGRQAAVAGSWEGVAGRRTAACGVALVPGFDGVEVRAKLDDGDRCYAYVVGTQTCGSVWGCPTCEAKIRHGRATEIEEGARIHTANGGRLLMVTLTLRHQKADPLADLITGLRDAWRNVQQSKAWRPLRSDLLGIVTAMEITMGPNGWHPHLHLLLFVRSGVSVEVLADELRAWMPAAWKASVAGELAVSPNLQHGCHVQALDADAAAYVSKIADETARGDLKSDARNPMGLVDLLDLDALADTEHADHQAAHQALGKWSEYVKATKGRSSVRWSRGLRVALGIGADETNEADAVAGDEALAAADEGGALVEVLDHRQWLRMSRTRDETGVLLAVRHLEAVERAGLPQPAAA